MSLRVLYMSSRFKNINNLTELEEQDLRRI